MTNDDWNLLASKPNLKELALAQNNFRTDFGTVSFPPNTSSGITLMELYENVCQSLYRFRKKLMTKL